MMTDRITYKTRTKVVDVYLNGSKVGVIRYFEAGPGWAYCPQGASARRGAYFNDIPAVQKSLEDECTTEDSTPSDTFPPVRSWPKDEDCDRAIAALEKARMGTRGRIPRQAMRKALIAGLHPPDNRTQDEKDYEFDRLLGPRS